MAAVRPERRIFIAYPWKLYEDVVEYKRAYTTGRTLQVKFVFAEQEITTGTVLDKISGLISSSAFGIYDVSNSNPNVTFEYGMAIGLGRRAFLAFNPEKNDRGDVISDVRGYDRLQYKDLDDLTSLVECLVVQELGTGAGAVDPLEAHRRELLKLIKRGHLSAVGSRAG